LHRISLLLLSAAFLVAAAACSSNDNKKTAATPSGPATTAGPTSPPKPVTLRLGYFPNVTHVQPIVGIARGTFKDDLGPNVTLDTSKTFNAGPAAVEALFAGSIDATYIGPNPTVNAYVKSKGQDVRVIAGAVSGGAQLIVREAAGITKPADFANRKVASPQLGGTQDVALRTWLKSNGLNAKEQGGNVTVLPTANADTLTLFQKGDIDAAWVPEPWGTRLIQEAGGKLFVDEASLWPGGQWVTTNLIVKTSFLKDHPDVVENLLKAHVETTEWIKANPEDAKALVNKGIEQLTGKALSQKVIDAAWKNITVTDDPLASTLTKAANDAYALEFLDSKPDLSALYALDLLNKVLKAKNLPEVKAN
jgi:NitT/TauT family transport system substrate-binding protein